MESALLERGTVEFEAARVAAAFGVEEWKQDDGLWRGIVMGDVQVWWSITFDAVIAVIQLGQPGSQSVSTECTVNRDEDGQWHLFNLWWHNYDCCMARGLYRLGFEDESVLSQVPELSAHEKLELRLSMPREFWPQGWLGEETK